MSDDRLRRVQDRIRTAERALDLALADLEPSLRAQKQMITDALRSALDKVSKAREALDAIVSAPDPLVRRTSTGYGSGLI